MKRKILLIDGEGLLHQSFHKFTNFKSTDGKPSGAIFGFFKSLHMYLERFNPNVVNIVFDNGHSPYRMEILKDYKAHRKNISIDFESLQTQKREIMKVLKWLRIPYIFDKNKVNGYEGDDYVAWLVYEKYSVKGDNVTIVTSDKDYNQLLSDHVKIFNPRKNEIVYPNNCEKIFGYKSSQTVDYLCLVGDTSDDIPGIKGYGPVKTKKLLDKFNAVDEAYSAKELSEENWEVYLRNKKLIDLHYFVQEHYIGDKSIPWHIRKGPQNWDRFKKFSIEYSLASFMTDVFMKPFKDYYNENNVRRS